MKAEQLKTDRTALLMGTEDIRNKETKDGIIELQLLDDLLRQEL